MRSSTQSPKKLFRLGISQSIVLGFFLLLAISFVVTGFHFSGLNQYRQHFSLFQKTSNATNKMLKFDKDITEFQRQILAFSNTEKITNTTQIKSLHQQLAADIQTLIADDSADHQTKSQLLNQIYIAIEGLSEKVDSLDSQRNARKTIITQLIQGQKQIKTQVDQLFLLAEKTQNAQLISSLWLVEHHLANFQYLSNNYFHNHNFQQKKEATDNINQSEKMMLSLASSTRDAKMQKLMQETLQAIGSNKLLLTQAVQSDRNYLFLINVVLAGETAEISNLSEELRKLYLDQQQELIANTEQHSLFIKDFSIFSSIAGILLASLIVLFIINRIRVPLISITDTFSRLALGENLQQIPGTDRVDEIGKLAQAANVFRQTNANTQTLLAQAEEFTRQLKQREIELELAVKKAEAANVSKSQFLANMSHELRTPMNAILGMLSLLQKTELNTRQTDYALKTEGAAKSLLGVLNDILDLSKAEAGKMELDPTPFNLDILIRDLSVILSTNLANKPVELNIDIDKTIPRYLLGDSLRLQQILINLGGNAIKFTEKGEVTISISLESNSVEAVTLKFNVKDSGIGIAAENQQKIFSGFIQAESSTTRRFGGTGLGLAISQRLVALMGGQLSLQSELGVGSQFSFSIQLPILSAEQIAELNTTSEKNSTGIQKQRLATMKILLVEDNLTNQQIALELLQAEGALIEVANNGLEAIDFLTQHLRNNKMPGVDVILMDLQMPVMDGITATEKIRHELQLRELPIIAMTANAMKSDREACLKAGMNEHLGKPFDLHQVIKTLRTQVGWPDIEAKKELTASNTSEPIPTTEIDVASAITRMGGNQSLYLKMLPKFLDNLSKLPTQLNSLLTAGDIPAIARELHSLKGLSATMGALQLSEEIAQIEKILKHHPDHPDAANMVRTACELINQSTETVKALIAKSNA